MTVGGEWSGTGQGNHEGCPYGADDGGSPPRPWMPACAGMTEGGDAGMMVRAVRLNGAALRTEALDSSLRGSSVQNDSAGEWSGTGQGNHEGCPYGADDGGSPPRPWMPVVTGMTEGVRRERRWGVVRLSGAALRAEALDSSLRGSSVQNDSAGGDCSLRASLPCRREPTAPPPLDATGMTVGGVAGYGPGQPRGLPLRCGWLR